MAQIRYRFTARVWKYPCPASWYFVSVPNGVSKEIRRLSLGKEEGWGRLKAIARIGDAEWPTALWYDTRHHTYLMPIKAEIRKRVGISEGSNVKVSINV
ncbi:MAG: DUF1905 domain-containing protein [Bacteroidota bacterium]